MHEKAVVILDGDLDVPGLYYPALPQLL